MGSVAAGFVGSGDPSVCNLGILRATILAKWDHCPPAILRIATGNAKCGPVEATLHQASMPILSAPAVVASKAV